MEENPSDIGSLLKFRKFGNFQPQIGDFENFWSKISIFFKMINFNIEENIDFRPKKFQNS